ncbi:hypothetical protein [Helicobacter sp. 23-1046]
MKKFVAFLFVGMLGASVLSASEVRAQQSASGLQSQDMEMLFGANADAKDLNVAVLSEEEMKQVQGEFWAKFFAVVVVETIEKIGDHNGWW